MAERPKGNETERLQRKYRDYRTRNLYGSHPFNPHPEELRPVVPTGTIIYGDPIRRARTKAVTDLHRRLLE